MTDEHITDLQATRDYLDDLLQSGQDSAFCEGFAALHEYEMAQVYLNLSEHLRIVAWRLLPPAMLALVFDNLTSDDGDRVSLLHELPTKLAAAVLQDMYTDNAADLLRDMSDRQVATYLSLIAKADAQEIRQLLNYDDETAGSLMSTEYMAVEEQRSVAEVMALVKQQALEAESLSYVYVKDQYDCLIGVISLRDLLTHPDDWQVANITNTRVISATAGDDREDVARLLSDYNFLSIPITDDDHHLLGVITADDAADVLDELARDDYSGLAAVNVAQVDDTAVHSAVKRIPWLVALLLLGMSTASLISHFDALVKQAAVLAVFISLITGTAGNAGTQALALAVRRLAVGQSKRAWRTLLSEIITGLLVGLVTGASVFVIVVIWKHNVALGLAVGLAMMMAIMVANLAGYLIPVLMDKLGLDPAVASGPFITTLSDLTSVLIYFSVAQMFISHFIGQ